MSSSTAHHFSPSFDRSKKLHRLNLGVCVCVCVCHSPCMSLAHVFSGRVRDRIVQGARADGDGHIDSDTTQRETKTRTQAVHCHVCARARIAMCVHACALPCVCVHARARQIPCVYTRFRASGRSKGTKARMLTEETQTGREPAFLASFTSSGSHAISTCVAPVCTCTKSIRLGQMRSIWTRKHVCVFAC